MRRIVAVVLVLMIALNAILLFPQSSPEADVKTEECSLLTRPKIEITEVNPGILPNLLKSTSSAL